MRGLFLMFMATCMAGAAWAADCSGPDGVGGEIIFNVDHKVMQFCDGEKWRAMAGNGGGSGGPATPLLPPTTMPDIIGCLHTNPNDVIYYQKAFHYVSGTSTRYDNANNGYVYYHNTTGAKGTTTGNAATDCPANISGVPLKYNLKSAGGGGGGGSTPTGAIMAFDLATCPDGWSVYTAAQGRFLRGIDPSGTIDPSGVRIAGNTQGDATRVGQDGWETGGSTTNSSLGALAAHHSGVYHYGVVNTAGAPNPTYTVKSTLNNSFDATYGRAAETRPKNVAVLYCRKD